MPLYHLIGALDPLTDSDIETRIDDGLPETLPEWIAADGLTHLKIKLNGEDLDWDVARVLAIEAEKTIVVNPQELIAFADRHKLVIVSIDQPAASKIAA